jgi:1-pyrroline-5-carboxylate dehydrogenase
MVMHNGNFQIEKPKNEPTWTYLLGSRERGDLEITISELREKKIDIPLIIAGKEVRTGNIGESVVPYDHQHVLAEYHKASEAEVLQAIDSALEARKSWATMPWYYRASIFLKAADLIAGPNRSTLNAAVMLNMSKNVYQAEVDAINELVDFLRFNVYYMQEIYNEQPESGIHDWSRVEYRPLEGFVFAVTPFNFAAIMGNLPTAPAMAGNTVVWKPASSAVFAAYHVMKILMEAGLPPGVINFIPGSGAKVGNVALKHPALAGVHFTGSTNTFRSMWKTVGQNIDNYKTYPRIVGETGGKGFVFAHDSADIEQLSASLVLGAFQFQGQKCSAASRAYIPKSIWPDVQENIVKHLAEIKVGNVEDFSTFMGAVIDQQAFKKIVEYIEHVKESKKTTIIAGGNYDSSKGYFIEPTVVLTTDPTSKTMVEEIFGPVLTVYVYPEDEFESTLHLCDQTSPYGLTGAIFGKNRKAIALAMDVLVNAAGNFYINDKPTGAVVNLQPFGGARASGTNDKAGSKGNMLRWMSLRTIKENFNPPRSILQDYMKEP